MSSGLIVPAVCAILVLSNVAVSPNRPDVLAQKGNYINETNEEPDLSTPSMTGPDFRDGSICADYEEGETPPAHLQCSDEKKAGSPESDVTISTDKQGYSRGERVVIEGWINPAILIEENKQTLIGYYDSEGKRIGYLYADIDDNGHFTNSELVIPDDPTIYPSGQWRLGVTYGNEGASAIFEVKMEEWECWDLWSEEAPMESYPEECQAIFENQEAIEGEECPPGMEVECGYMDAEIVGALPVEIKGKAAADCEETVSKAFLHLLEVNENEDSTTLDGLASKDYYKYVDKYSNTIRCNDKNSHGALAYAVPYRPYTIHLNPSAYDWSLGSVIVNRELEEKFLAGVLVHEAHHLQQFRKCFVIFCQVYIFGGKYLEWYATVEEAKSLWLMNVTWGPGYDRDQFYESFLLYWYDYYMNKPMPAEEYQKRIGKEPPVSTTSLTENIPNELEDFIEKNWGDRHDEDSIAFPAEPLNNVTIAQDSDGSVTLASEYGMFNTTEQTNEEMDRDERDLLEQLQEETFIEVFEVRNSNNVTVYIELQSRTLGQNESSASWMPERPGEYRIRTFAISSLDSPLILSLVQESYFTIKR